MLQPFQPLRRAVQLVGAATHGFTFRPDGRCPAFGTCVGKVKGRSIIAAVSCDDTYHLRDHIAGALNDNAVANTDILAADFILIMQRGVGHHYTANRDWCQTGHRRQRAGASHLNIDFIQQGFSLFGGKFVRQRPARCACHLSKPFLIIMPVHLVDDAINIITKRGPLAADFGVMVQQPGNIAAAGRQAIDAEAKPLERCQKAGMGVGNRGARLAG